MRRGWRGIIGGSCCALQNAANIFIRNNRFREHKAGLATFGRLTHGGGVSRILRSMIELMAATLLFVPRRDDIQMQL